MVVIPTSYLGNMAYYKTFIENKECKIEGYEHYLKQSFRSRCNILGSNGRLTLSIPILRGGEKKQIVKDVQIEYIMEWQKQHWRSIVSAYKSSPYFEEFEDLFAPHFYKKEKFLIDFNQKLHSTIIECIDERLHRVGFTDVYQTKEELEIGGQYSLRDELSSTKFNDTFEFKPYYQVFSDKFEFEPNLSIIDYLFCEGPSGVKQYVSMISEPSLKK